MINHCGVQTDVMNRFNAMDNFLRLVTHAYIVYLALKLCNMNDVEDTLEGSIPHGSYNDREAFFQQTCERRVGEIGQLPSVHVINRIYETDLYELPHEWCFCSEGIYKL